MLEALELKLIISGRPNAGKVAIARIVADELQKLGINAATDFNHIDEFDAHNKIQDCHKTLRYMLSQYEIKISCDVKHLETIKVTP